jgi:ABC-type uncharacterized transport system permease subunit
MKRLSLRNALSASVIAALTGLGLLLLSASEPAKALAAFFTFPLTQPLFLSNLIEQAALILLCALGFSIAFRTGAFNLGGEGQFAVGALAAAVFAGSFPAIPMPISAVLAGGFAALCAGGVGGLIGLLRVKANISEIIGSFLASLAIIPLVDWLVSGPWRGSDTGLLSTAIISGNYWLPKIGSPVPISIGIFASLAAALMTWFVLRHSLFGYDSRVISSNPEFGKTQGVPIGQRLVVSFILSAAFHGVAGATAVLATTHAAFAGMSGGVAWAGIAAALIAKAHPLVAIAGSLVLAYLQVGSQAAIVYSNISFEITLVMQGVFFLFITARTFGAKRD